MDNDLMDESEDGFRLLTDKGVFIFCLAIIFFLFVFHPYL
jgi:hypothetical protein